MATVWKTPTKTTLLIPANPRRMNQVRGKSLTRLLHAQCCGTECVCLPTSHVEAVTLSVMAFGGVAFGKRLSLQEVMKVGLIWCDQGPYLERHPSMCSLLPEDIARRQPAASPEETSPETKSTALDLDIQPSNL